MKQRKLNAVKGEPLTVDRPKLKLKLAEPVVEPVDRPKLKLKLDVPAMRMKLEQAAKVKAEPVVEPPVEPVVEPPAVDGKGGTKRRFSNKISQETTELKTMVDSYVRDMGAVQFEVFKWGGDTFIVKDCPAVMQVTRFIQEIQDELFPEGLPEHEFHEMHGRLIEELPQQVQDVMNDIGHSQVITITSGALSGLQGIGCASTNGVKSTRNKSFRRQKGALLSAFCSTIWTNRTNSNISSSALCQALLELMIIKEIAAVEGEDPTPNEPMREECMVAPGDGSDSNEELKPWPKKGGNAENRQNPLHEKRQFLIDEIRAFQKAHPGEWDKWCRKQKFRLHDPTLLGFDDLGKFESSNRYGAFCCERDWNALYLWSDWNNSKWNNWNNSQWSNWNNCKWSDWNKRG